MITAGVGSGWDSGPSPRALGRAELRRIRTLLGLTPERGGSSRSGQSPRVWNRAPQRRDFPEWCGHREEFYQSKG